MELLLILSFFTAIFLPFSFAEELCDDERALSNPEEEYIGHGCNRNRGHNHRDNFKCPFPFGNFPDPDSCSKFYVCVMGKAINRKCRNNLKFDMFRMTCVRSKFVICGGGGGHKETTTNPSPTTKNPGKKLCPAFKGQFADPEDCSKYFQCTFFIATPKTCPEGQLYDAVQSMCHPADKVHCGDRPRPGENPVTTDDDYEDETTPTGLPTTTEKVRRPPPETDCPEGDDDCLIDKMGDPDDWFKCPEAVAAFPHPSSERLFIFCLNWEPTVKKCGLDMIFSKKFFICLNPHVDDDEETFTTDVVDDDDDATPTDLPLTTELEDLSA